MTDWKPKHPRDPNQLAKAIVDIATEGAPEESATVKRARKGGLSGGKARAKALTPEQRADIARQAATARWKKSD
ncbi:MAG: histone H1 [Inquilinaceae bacterium]